MTRLVRKENFLVQNSIFAGPSIVLLMCSWHQKKASEKHMKDIKKTDVEIWDQLRFDITTLQLFSVDEESFNVAYKLLERKYVQIEVDKELMTILRLFFRYFSDECIICTRKKAWFHSAYPLGPTTNNSLERMNRTFKVTTFSYDYIITFSPLFTFLAPKGTFLAQIVTILARNFFSLESLRDL